MELLGKTWALIRAFPYRVLIYMLGKTRLKNLARLDHTSLKIDTEEIQSVLLPPVFYDVESSGLDGLPIEIGWAFVDPEDGNIHAESLLICPTPGWDIASTWDESAERLHGITLDLLYVDGVPPNEVVRRMNEELDGRELFSDAPGWDTDWLQKIFVASNIKPSFAVSIENAYTVIGAHAKTRGWNKSDSQTTMLKVAADYPRTHRAANDARHLAALWLAMTNGP